MTAGISSYVSLNSSKQKEKLNIWFEGGDLNSFQDIRPFLKGRGQS